MSRDEHIAWCKERAITEMDFYNDPTKGLISMMSDLRKHPDTANHAGIPLTAVTIMLSGVKPMTRQETVTYINGFR